MWNRLKHRTQGALPITSLHNAPQPFQAESGHNYDLWSWPWPAQSTQYQDFFNAWQGNQLPSFFAFVPIIATNRQLNRPWVTTTNVQQQNAFQTALSGQRPLQFGQQQSANYIAKIGQRLASGSGGRTRRKRR